MEDLLLRRVADVADILDVNANTIYNWIRRGVIASIRIGVGRRATIRIPQAEIDRVLREGYVPNVQPDYKMMAAGDRNDGPGESKAD
jgi:excisionase family DNA binding protein